MQESISWNGEELSIETGNWAKQAHGSVVYRHGKLVLLATVCAEKEAREGQEFFPLTVDYREKTYAVGKFPGGYIKRENRPAEHETLISRLIDRPIRPLFPEGYFCEVQLLVTVLSADPEKTMEGHAITAASAALAASDIPFLGPVAGVVVGRKDGAFVADPDTSVIEEGELELVVAGTKDAVMMIEGAAKEVSPEYFIEAIDFAHQKIKEKIVAQERLAAKLNLKKREVHLRKPDEELRAAVREFALEKLRQANRTPNKQERGDAIDQVNKAALDFVREKLANDTSRDLDASLREIKGYLHELEYIVVRDLIFGEGVRADGRKTDEIRDISTELDVLPAAHGSAVFTRGQTQSLGVVTLGTGDDYQRIEFLSGEHQKNFMLHYNFPPFSTGEVKRMMGPGRREIGHGNLAERALRAVVPSKVDFPYVIRIVSEILESNGSSSMASVCSGSMAMMAAGVPVKGQVAGIAMGLIMGDNGKYVILSDIAGLEDHFGDMDFKVAGTERGITAFQLDIKVAGLSVAILRDALAQADRGRMHILGKMNEAISAARPAVPENAPLVMTMQISPDRIGELIGPGGKIIRSIIERSKAELNVEDDGTVTIAAINKDRAEHAKRLIEELFREVEVGQTYTGVVKRITDFGAFVELFPGKDGLLHISKMSKNRIQSVKEVMDIGTEVTVAVLGVDSLGRVNLILKDLADSMPPGSFDGGREERGGDREHRGGRGGGRGGDRGRRH
ncbi:polyribonucleotide nucleotidyltransferase [Leptonema illini]|jgi:polyribonucleotide nucleotidyltransferase|uniref:Polyribonucleotide nucleotidyltransferase n=1 Tax=Leptonema illini DSM 21528 TaxID=929563 RepID=H2CAZ3_9LEPT|nr:Polyribonucleotide nucleotidyltransferase [Leptonema illini DSM 21528]